MRRPKPEPKPQKRDAPVLVEDEAEIARISEETQRRLRAEFYAREAQRRAR